VLILVFATVSGSHFNPVVSLADAALGGRWRDVPAYIPAQVLGCIGGAALANVMFGGAALSISTTERLDAARFLSEIVATAGLVLVIFALARTGRAASIPWAVGAYIGAAYFFTSSTSFANPAITVGRIFSDTFAGIAPASAPGFIAAQLLGGALGYMLVRLFFPHPAPHPASTDHNRV
jgi:arsenate reductase